MSQNRVLVEPTVAPDLSHKGRPFELDDEKENSKSSICCFQGCLAASAVGFAFFVALPTGIILIVLSTNSKDTTLLAIGCVLVVLPVIILVTVIILCLNQKRLCCNKIKKQTSVRTQQMQVVQTTTCSGESPI